MEDSGFKETNNNEDRQKDSFKAKVEEYYNALQKKVRKGTEPKAYILFDGKSVSGLLLLIKELLVDGKHMDIQELTLADGSILLQSRTKKGYLKQFAGLDYGVTVHIKDYKNGQIEIYLSECKWMDKAFAAALTWFTIWPLLVVPGVGTYMQIVLKNDINKLLEDYFAIE